MGKKNNDKKNKLNECFFTTYLLGFEGGGGLTMNPKWDIFLSDAGSEAAMVASTFSVGSFIEDEGP